MTKLEKNQVKRKVISYNWWAFSLGLLGIIEWGLSFYLMIDNAIIYRGLSLFGLLMGFILLVTALIISAKSVHTSALLTKYRKDINKKRDQHYYNMVCVYSKRGNIEKAKSFCDLIRDERKKYTMIGFVLNDNVSKDDNYVLNAVMKPTYDNMKKYGM